MTQEQIKEIIDEFCKNANEEWVGDCFDGGFLETTVDVEDTWEDTPINRVWLIDNYLVWYGYDNVEPHYLAQGESCKTVGQLLKEYKERHNYNFIFH